MSTDVTPMQINMFSAALLKYKPRMLICIWVSSKWYSGSWLLFSVVYCCWFADIIVCTYDLMKDWIPRMLDIPCTENLHKILIGIDESTGMCPGITANKILYLSWILLLILKSINMLVWMVIEKWWKLIFILCRYISQGCGYLFERDQNELIGCDCEFVTFNVSVVLIILCTSLIC